MHQRWEKGNKRKLQKNQSRRHLNLSEHANYFQGSSTGNYSLLGNAKGVSDIGNKTNQVKRIQIRVYGMDLGQYYFWRKR